MKFRLTLLLLLITISAFSQSLFPVVQGSTQQIVLQKSGYQFDTYLGLPLLDSVPTNYQNQGYIQSFWRRKSDSSVMLYNPITRNSIVVGNKSVSIPQTDFIVPSSNLFNQRDTSFKSGYYINNNNGTILPDPLFNATGFTPVIGGSQYTFSYKNGLAWYNSSKVFVSGNPSSDTNKTQTAPLSAYYVRATVSNAALPTYQIVKGSSLPAYEPYLYKLVSPDGTKISSYVSAIELQNTAESDGTKSLQIAYAPRLYALAGKELNIYYENIVKYYEAYKGKMVFDYTPSSITGTPRVTGRGFKITPTNAGTIGINLSVGNEKFEYLLAFSPTQIIVADTTTTTPVTIMNFGDSYEQGSIFTDYIRSTAANAGLTFVGIKQGEQAPANQIRTEGRGGKTLAYYFTVDTVTYNPFMQPTSIYSYYGNTSHWKDALSGSPSYLAKDYPTAIKSLFNASTGFLNSPTVNSLMYDNSTSSYKSWDGTSWVIVPSNTITWKFNFAKYRQIWNITAINIFHVKLGTNDWGNTNETQTTSQWPTYKANMDSLIASVQTDLPNCRIVIAICPSSGRQGEDGNFYTERRKRAYWINAKNIISTYSKRENEKLYVMDYHATIDRVNGFNRTLEPPYKGYSGTTNWDTYVSDYTHIYKNAYDNQMGPLYMAIIQYLRSL